MLGKDKSLLINKLLDEPSRSILQAAAGNEDDAETIAESPFLYARLRTRIRAEQERQLEKESWTVFLGVMRRAVPVMSFIAVFSVALLWFVGVASPSSAIINDQALVDARDGGIEQVIFAERRPLSSDEILHTILEQDE